MESTVDTLQTLIDAREGVVWSQGQRVSPFEGVRGEENSARNTPNILKNRQPGGKDSDAIPHGLRDWPLIVFLSSRYLYCDEIQLEADTVLATLYVAKKYIVPHLARACVTYLETSLTAKNACLLLSQSRLFEEPDLMQRCWEVIDAQVRLRRVTLATTDLAPLRKSIVHHSVQQLYPRL